MQRIIGAFLNDYPGEQYKPRFQQEAEGRGFEVRFLDYAAAQDEDLAGLEILFGHPSAAVLRHARDLKWFCNCWAGMDAYGEDDLKNSPGCLVTNSSGAYGLMIAEHVVMSLLMLCHRQREYDRLIADGEWHRVEGVIDTLYGKRVTILGTGDIGTETAARLRPFGTASITGISRSGRVKPGFDRVLTPGALDSLLPETDILVSAVPATAETKDMLNAARLSLLPGGAYLVNVGRGSVLDQEALVSLLDAGALSGAVLDVTTPEPLPFDHPLRRMDNVILTPHIAGSLVALNYTCTKTIEMFLADLDRYTEGLPLMYTASLRRGY